MWGVVGFWYVCLVVFCLFVFNYFSSNTEPHPNGFPQIKLYEGYDMEGFCKCNSGASSMASNKLKRSVCNFWPQILPLSILNYNYLYIVCLLQRKHFPAMEGRCLLIWGINYLRTDKLEAKEKRGVKATQTIYIELTWFTISKCSRILFLKNLYMDQEQILW